MGDVLSALCGDLSGQSFQKARDTLFQGAMPVRRVVKFNERAAVSGKWDD
jgi:hypothetical protein